MKRMEGGRQRVRIDFSSSQMRSFYLPSCVDFLVSVFLCFLFFLRFIDFVFLHNSIVSNKTKLLCTSQNHPLLQCGKESCLLARRVENKILCINIQIQHAHTHTHTQQMNRLRQSWRPRSTTINMNVFPRTRPSIYIPTTNIPYPSVEQGEE